MRVGTKQAEVLILAHHGDVGVLRGAKAQITALQRKGLLDERQRPTELGTKMYDELGERVVWHDGLKRLGGYGAPFEDRATGLSADGLTAYIARKRSGPVVAIDVESIPTKHLGEFGLAREPFLGTIVRVVS